MIKIRATGDFACFTHPLMKVERRSYPVMTPTAAAGMLRAIYGKPQFDWVIHEIKVCKPIQYFSIMTNEVKTKVSSEPNPINGIYGPHVFQDACQRVSSVLTNVEYVVSASIQRNGGRHAAGVHQAIFKRRMRRGDYFTHPVLGMHPFFATLNYATGEEQPIDLDLDLGPVPLTVNKETGFTFFNARLEQGVLKIGRAHV